MQRLEPAVGSLLDAATASGETRGDISPKDLLYAVASPSLPVADEGVAYSQRMVRATYQRTALRGRHEPVPLLKPKTRSGVPSRSPVRPVRPRTRWSPTARSACPLAGGEQ